jgi:hypothetical protein
MKTDRIVRCRGSHIFHTIGSQMAVSLSALLDGRPLPPGIFLVLISVRGSVDPRAISRLEGSGQFNNSSDLIRNRTRDLPACSILPQPTTQPHAPRGDTSLMYKTVGSEIIREVFAISVCRLRRRTVTDYVIGLMKKSGRHFIVYLEHPTE